MQNIIVLGMIPGTNIVLTFNEWLFCIGFLLATFKVLSILTNNFFGIRLYLNLIAIILVSKIINSRNQLA